MSASATGDRSGTSDATRRATRDIVLLMGAVGAGKGTQAKILEARLGMPHLASGDLFREAIRDGSVLGERARAFMERGDLVPDDVTTELIIERLARTDTLHGAILDGFPRTVTQAEALDATLAQRGERVTRVLYFDVPTDELVRRTAGRLVCPVDGSLYHVQTNPPRVAGRCDIDGVELVERDDDRPDVVRARLEKQIPPMLEVVDYYERQGVVTRIDGRRPIEEVTETLLSALGASGGRVGLPADVGGTNAW
ncbi:MAG: nucleoside monophosphate kinase [Chloroflexota bacterium]|nr:nucleoside monophosphate kinase [Chloroflexota bacterium]